MAGEILGIATGSGNGSLKLSKDKISTEYTLLFFIRAADPSDGAVTVRNTPGLPRVGTDTYNYKGESDPTAVCSSKQADRTPKSRTLWKVTCKFTSEANSKSQENEDNRQEPDQRLPDVDWDAELEERILTEDFSTPPKPVVNSAGEAIPATYWVPMPVVTITRWQDAFSFSDILTYSQKTNSKAFLGAPIGSALMESIKAKLKVEEGKLMWQVTYRIKFSVLPEKHLVKLLDTGSYFLDAAGDKQIETPDGKNLGSFNLDGYGQLAAPGAENYLEFVRAKSVDFDDLNLVS